MIVTLNIKLEGYADEWPLATKLMDEAGFSDYPTEPPVDGSNVFRYVVHSTQNFISESEILNANEILSK